MEDKAFLKYGNQSINKETGKELVKRFWSARKLALRPERVKGFSTDPWKISTPPKGSIKTSSIILQYISGVSINSIKIIIEKAYYLTK